jgi:hypothetical protein
MPTRDRPVPPVCAWSARYSINHDGDKIHEGVDGCHSPTRIFEPISRIGRREDVRPFNKNQRLEDHHDGLIEKQPVESILGSSSTKRRSVNELLHLRDRKALNR